MIANLAHILGTLPPAQWEVRQVFVLEWHDAPLEGFCELAAPACCFHFKALAENKLAAADYLFSVARVTDNAMALLLDACASIGPPATPLWTPIWVFPTAREQREAGRV